MSSNFFAPDASLFFSKNDLNDVRFGDLAQKPDALFQLVGYPDDEGIKLNGGRIGASLAPDLIRRAFYKMTPSHYSDQLPHFFDHGNINAQLPLEKKHELAQELTSTLFAKQKQVLTLGGGHDYGFPDASAFVENFNMPVVINFDAHLDVRPTDSGFHSGTPFRRLLEKHHGKFHFFEVGLLPQCNSRAHAKWAKDMGAILCSVDELLVHLGKMTHRPAAWISLDMDVFSSSIAPGCSQSWGNGMNFESFSRTLEFITKNLFCKGMGVYEVSPPFDHDNMTSKLAAVCLHQYVDQVLRNSRS